MYTRVPGALRVAWKEDSKQSHWVSVFSPLSLISPSPLPISLPICRSLYPSLSSQFLLPSLLHFSPSSTPLPNFLFPPPLYYLISLSCHLSPFSLSSSFSHPISTHVCTMFCLQFLSFFFLSPHLSLFFCLSSLIILPNLSPIFLYLLSTHFPLCQLSLSSISIPFMASSYRLCHGFLHIVGDVA